MVLILFNISSGFGKLLDSNNPTILSASLTADTSGVVTTKALSAPAIAFLKPCSIPAGQSTKTKSFVSFNWSQMLFNCYALTADLSLV